MLIEMKNIMRKFDVEREVNNVVDNPNNELSSGDKEIIINEENEKDDINVEDFIPEEYLPTFSSHVIEWNLHRIPDLFDNFVYFFGKHVYLS